MLANHLGPPLTDPLRHLDRLGANPRELSALPDRYGAFLEPRIYWSPTYASPDEPGRFRAFAVVSTPPGNAPDPFLRAIEAGARRAGLRVRDTFSSGATRESPYPTGFTDLLKRVTEAAFPGIPFGPVPTYGGITTSVYFRDRGFSAYGYSPIPMNITDSSRRHGNNERIFLRDYVEGVRLYSEIVAEYAAQGGNNLSPPSRGR
jgi:acetylornithine deacetylase/succinyl-diaminopimelate desuccinylase-like protein